MSFTASWDDCGRVVAGADVKLQRFGVFTVSDGDRYAFNGAKPAFDGAKGRTYGNRPAQSYENGRGRQFRLYRRIVVSLQYYSDVEMIDRNTIQRVMDAADIVDVVKEFVTLRKAGVNYKGLCPFHDEKTPSFVVSPSKQYCKCFSCGKGGNVVHFIMEHEQLTYPEAIKWLGRKYGIEVHDKEMTDDERQRESTRESMFVLNEWARDYFSDLLHNNVDGVALGMGYFRQRGFRDDIIRKFQLGYALPARDALAKAALANGFNEEFLVRTGLCYRTDDGRLLDRYHDRVIFPVHTVSGKVVAFGGRILSSDKKLAKYINSPESEIYSKSHELYGLYLAKHAIVKANRCYLVEGYTDVISMHQCGIENVVASSGTSLTEGQIRLIHRFTENITVLYDGDSAGIKASLRGIDMLLAEGLNVKVLLLPDGDDPDSFARKHTAADYQAYIEAHQVDFIRFKIDLLLSGAESDPVKHAEMIRDVVRSVSVVPEGITRQMYVRESAARLGVSEQLILSEVNQLRRENGADGVARQSAPAEQTADTAGPSQTAPIRQEVMEHEEERLLIAAVMRFGNRLIALEDGTGVTVASYIAEDLAADALEFRQPLFRRILQEACAYPAADGEVDPSKSILQYFMSHPDGEVSGLAMDLGTDRYVLSQRQQEGYVADEDRLYELIPRLLHDYKNSLVRAEMKQLLQQLRQPEVAQDSARCVEIMRRYQELSKVEQQFAKVLGDRVVSLS